MEMKVVIIDDEPGAIIALRNMMERYGKGFTVVGEARTALEGIKLIQREQPALVLLDIEMPHGSGFDLLEAFPKRAFHVIYTTAHEKHAVRAAHTHPFDYLLKPVDPDDLSRALDQLMAAQANGHAKRIEVSSVQGKAFINVDDILRIEADGGYSTIHTTRGEKHVASKGIGYYEELLPKDRFFRCHHSHLISMRMVTGYLNQDGGTIRLADGALVPIATRRYAEFLMRNKAIG
jgi:two-component system, LytTR family, response regulator